MTRLQSMKKQLQLITFILLSISLSSFNKKYRDLRKMERENLKLKCTLEQQRVCIIQAVIRGKLCYVNAYK